MSGLHRTWPFLRAYRYAPHRLINGLSQRLAEAQHPRWLVQAAIRKWVRSAGIDLDECEREQFSSLQDFFLRRLKPSARPLGSQLVSPVDGCIVAAGSLDPALEVAIKGHPLSLSRVAGGGDVLAPCRGGAFAVLFLSPNDYHHVHMPEAAHVTSVHSIQGRYYPQNDAALATIARVHERNERAVLVCQGTTHFVLVMVGASVVGGIHLARAQRSEWVRSGPVPVNWSMCKGERLGHFAFGSTVVMFAPHGYQLCPELAAGQHIRMGQSLFRGPMHKAVTTSSAAPSV